MILHGTSFDDGAGGGASIDDAQPPYTGTFEPDRPLAPMLATQSTGTWTLSLSNRSSSAAELLDWTLELRAEATPVSFANYIEALGQDDSAAARRAYATARPPQDGSSELFLRGQGGADFVLGHWRWTSPADLSYSYERNAPGGWIGTAPARVSVTRYPGGIEYHELGFPSGAPRRYFRMRADFTK